MAGLPKSYIKKYGISKRAWREYRKAQNKRKKSRSTTKKKSTSNRSVKKTARRSNLLATAFKFLRLGAFGLPALSKYAYYSNAGWKPMNSLVGALGQYAGFKPVGQTGELKMDLGLLGPAWLPLLLTSLVTVGIPKINGIIRRI